MAVDGPKVESCKVVGNEHLFRGRVKCISGCSPSHLIENLNHGRTYLQASVLEKLVSFGGILPSGQTSIRKCYCILELSFRRNSKDAFEESDAMLMLSEDDSGREAAMGE